MEINEEKLKGILGEHKKDTDTKIDEIKGHFDTVLKEHKKDTDVKIDAVLKEQRKEYQGYLGVLEESFDGKVKLIGEQYDSIIERLDSHDEKFTSIEKNIEIMKVDIVFIKNGLKKKVDVEEFETLENRVAILEATRSAA